MYHKPVGVFLEHGMGVIPKVTRGSLGKDICYYKMITMQKASNYIFVSNSNDWFVF